MRAAAIALLLAGCGDNLRGPQVGPALAPADTMFVLAHFDDDIIFMQPDLREALETGSVTTVYVTSGDPAKGDERADEVFAAARAAYSSVLGSHDWWCGYIEVAGLPVHHCRLGDYPVSLVALDVPDGGLRGARRGSLLHLVEGQIPAVEILGPIGGEATTDALIEELAQLIATTAPAQIHALDVAGTHGRDHSSHLMSSSFALWAAARAGYAGALRWHHGYNVADNEPTLAGEDYAAARRMLSVFDGCYFEWGRCGHASPKVDKMENAWLERQYAFDRVVPTAGTLALAGTSTCASTTPDGAVVLSDCNAASALHFDANGQLSTAGSCATALPDGSVAIAPCSGAAEQYWLADTEGHIWSGAPPDATAGMEYDHVRCLAPDLEGTFAAAPTCGATRAPTWLFR